MIGFNAEQDALDLSDLLQRSRYWLRWINQAILFHKKNNHDEVSENLCLYTVADVLDYCCRERIGVDFLGNDTNTHRQAYQLLFSLRKKYEKNSDEYFNDWDGITLPASHTVPSLLSKTDANAEQICLFQQSLPASVATANGDLSLDNYKEQYIWGMQILPMFDAIAFASDIIKQLRYALNRFQSNPQKNSRDWVALTDWQQVDKCDKAIKECRKICRTAIEARKGKLIAPFQHHGSPSNGMLDVFDNKYTILSEMANAHTSPAHLNKDEIALHVPLLQRWAGGQIASRFPGKPQPETVLLATYLWQRLQDLKGQADQYSQQWITFPGTAAVLGLYGDKRIAASSTIESVEKQQGAAGHNQLIKFLHVNGVVYMRLTPLAVKIFSQDVHAVSPCALVGAILYYRHRSSEAKSAEVALNSLGEELCKAVSYELNNEKQRFLVKKPDGKLSLTEHYRTQLNEMHNSFVAFQSQSNPRDELKQCADYLKKLNDQAITYNTRESKPDAPESLENIRTKVQFKTLLEKIASTNQVDDAIIQTHLENLKTHLAAAEFIPFLIAWGDLDCLNKDQALLDFADGLRVANEEQAAFKTAWEQVKLLDTFTIPDLRNDPYMVISPLMTEQKNPSRAHTSSVDQLVWQFMQGHFPEDDQRYPEAVWRIVDKATRYVMLILDCSIEPAKNKINANKRYKPVALGSTCADTLQNQSSATWWLTRVMRLLLVYLYKDDEFSPVFNSIKREPSADHSMTWDDTLNKTPKDELDKTSSDLNLLREKIVQKFLGSEWSWEVLDDWHADKSKKLPERSNVKEDYQAFLDSLTSQQYTVRVQPIPGQTADEDCYCFRVSEDTKKMPADIASWVEDRSPVRDKLPQEHCTLCTQLAQKQWADRLCSAMSTIAVKQPHETRSFAIKIDGAKQRLLLVLLAAAKTKYAESHNSIQSITTCSYPSKDKADNSLGFNMTLENGETKTFNDVCAELFNMSQESYEAFRKGLPLHTIDLTTSDITSETVTWEFNYCEQKER